MEELSIERSGSTLELSGELTIYQAATAREGLLAALQSG